MSPAEFTLMLNSSPSVDWDSSYDEKCLNVAASRALVTLTYPPYRRHKIYSNTYVQTMQEMRTLLLTMPTLINSYVRTGKKFSKTKQILPFSPFINTEIYRVSTGSEKKFSGFPRTVSSFSRTHMYVWRACKSLENC